MRLYAHSLENASKSDWQTLSAHLAGVADLATDFAAAFQSAPWGTLAGWLHDLGKADSRFQAYLDKCNGLDDTQYDGSRVNHSSAGAAFAMERLGPCHGKALAYLAAGHHAGLPDWHSGQASLQYRLEDDGKPNLEHSRQAIEGLFPTDLVERLPAPPSFLQKNPGGFHLWIRMLFSCLVDADYLDTESFMNPAKAGARSDFASLSQLKARFDDHMAKMTANARPSPVNRVRQEILAACRAAAKRPGGLFALDVPTGGGKTLSSMAFALDHAAERGYQRIIYVIPYTSIIEQTAGIFAGIFGRENVVEHHCNLNPDNESLRSQLAAENWDAPVIVTTNVQFFESLYAARSSRCRKLHNIANSVVVLDEAQTLPPTLLEPCVKVMNQLTRHYGVSLVLCTATQPSPPNLDEPVDIIPASLDLHSRMKRVEYHFPTDLNAPVSWPELAKELTGHERVLCVVNTRRDCRDLFNLMPEGTIHLSALMCGEHRSAVIDEIKQKLKTDQPLRVISTQLVEAGVDIDFPVVYRALAGLDSIAQAAGRCNREGKLKLGNVRVFSPPKRISRGLLGKGEQTTRELRGAEGIDPALPESFTLYFDSFYAKVNNTGSQFKELLEKNVNPDLAFQFRSAGKEFKFIEDQDQQTVLVRYGESPGLLERLRHAGPTRELTRRLQRYAVNLSATMASRMLAGGLLEDIHGVLVQTGSFPGLYDKVLGLDIFREDLPIEDLLV